ncbi:MAG: tetratricopeptide repeat protein, partial [Flavobacteriales bacterium]|nr:tetratricopeptide repeat protein [Flavobacteriales bacterium]
LQAITSGNIGIVYHRQEKYYKALEYYFKALKLDEEEENRSGVAGDYVYIGLIYSDLGEYARALEFYFKSLTIQEELVNKFGITGTLINIGEVYSLQKKYREAEAYLLRALEISREVKYLLSEQFCHEHLSTLYEQTGQYKKAYEHHMEYSIAKDSLFNEEKSKEIGKLEAKHEFEKAEAERKRTEEEQIDREASTKSRRDNLQYSGILIFIVLLFGGVFMLGRFSMPIRLAEGLTFFAFLLFFEFTLVLLDPYIENYSGGEPAYKLLFNAMLAGMIFPLHSFFETRLKTRIAKE